MSERPKDFVENDSKTLIDKPCCVVKGCDRPAFFDQYGILLCVECHARLRIEFVPKPGGFITRLVEKVG